MAEDESHPYGCEYEPAVVMIRQRVGELLFTVPMSGEICKWCGEEFVSAKLLNKLDEELSQALTTVSFDPCTKSERWVFNAPAIHLAVPVISTAIDNVGETQSSAAADSVFHVTAATTA